MKMKSNMCRILAETGISIALLFGATYSSNASSTVIMSYNAGSNGIPAVAPDPTSVEGGSWIFTESNPGDNMLSEGLSPDPLHPNLNTWRLLDNLTTAGVVRFSKVATDEQITNAIWCGWKGSEYLRIADPVPGNAGAFSMIFQFGSTNGIWNRRYVLYPDINANGALYVSSTTLSVTVTTNTTDALDYHLYEMIYDSATRMVELRVDGVVIHTNWPSLTIPASVDGCLWGAGSTAGRTDGYYNRVTIEVNDLSPATVTMNPTNATKNVAESVTFTAAFTGCATNLQWYKDSSPIPGANQRSYSIANIVPSDAGEYWMGIADPMTGNEVTTTPATLTLNPDSTPPTVVSVQPLLSLQHVRVTFSEGIDPVTAQNPENYQVADGALTVSNVTLEDLVSVVVQTSEQTANSNYDLILSGIQDQSGNTLVTVTQSFTAVNLLPVAVYNAGTEDNPPLAPDPTLSEAGRWTLVRGTNELFSSTGVSPDIGYGLNAWNITDNTTSAGQIDYRFSYPKESHEFARTNGWRLRARTRFVDDFNTTAAMLMSYGDGTGRRYFIFFDVSGIDLDLTASLGGGIITNLTTFGAGAFDYHTHEIVFDPETQRASYYFDGNLISSGWNGTTPSAAFNGPLFGAAASPGMGSMNYNLVEFSVNNATAPVIVTNPVSTNVTAGDSVTLNGSASGFVGGYQWYKDGSPIPTATGSSFTINSTEESDSGDYVLRAFTSSVEVESTVATLTVVAPPELSVNASAGIITVTFTGTLQSATNITDTFQNLTPQPGSPLTLTNPPNTLFFRSLKSPQ